MSNPFKTALRNFAVRALNVTPVLGKWLREGGFKPTPTYKPGSYLGLPRDGWRGVAGKLMPQPQVRTFKGKRVLLDEVLGEGFSLLGLENNPRVALSAESEQLLAALDTRYVTLYPFGGRPQGMAVQRFSPAGLVEVEEPDEALVRWFKRAGRGRDLVAVIRPDKFVFALVPAAQLDSVLAELRHQLGWQPNLANEQPLVAPLRKSA